MPDPIETPETPETPSTETPETPEVPEDGLISGVTALLDEVVAIRKRWETPHA